MNFRPLLFAAAGFGAGILAAEAFTASELPTPVLIAASAALIAALAVTAFFSIRKRSWALVIFAAAFLLGALRLFAAVPDDIPKGEYELRGTVASVSETDPYSVVLTRASVDGEKLKYKVRLRISDKSSDALEVGDVISTVCTVNVGSPGGEEIRLRLLPSGIELEARCEGYDLVSEHALPISELISSVRKALKERIAELFPLNGPMVTAFLLGDRSGLDYWELESFRATGTAHLLSLSGFHVGILTAGLMYLLPKRRPRLRFILIGIFLLLFCAVTGFAPSLVRASIMCACVLLADVAEERRDPLSSLSLAAILILAYSPYSLWSAGFRLSFAAALGIVLFVDADAVSTRSVFLNRALEAIIVSFAAASATMLLNAEYFGCVNTYTVPFNLIAVPFYSIAVMLSFIVVVIGIPVPFIAKYLAVVPDGLLGGVNLCLKKAAGLPYARIEVGRPYDICAFLMLLIMFMLSPYILRPIRKRVLITLPVILLFMGFVVLGLI